MAKNFDQSEERIRELVAKEEPQPIRAQESERRRGLHEKEAWLLGLTSGGGVAEPKGAEKREKVKKKEEIILRAKELEKTIKKSEESFKPELNKVGKIEQGDWNFRVWEKRELNEKEPKKEEKRVLAKNTKIILNSRKTQIENKIKESFGDSRPQKEPKKEQRAPLEGVFVQMIEKELNERMNKSVEKKATPDTTRDDTRRHSADAKTTLDDTDALVSTPPLCYRCGLEVSLVERISVQGDILHR